ncbi:hypothetical protein [Pseudomonas sp. DG56-2]|uniref:hypothetical protein n=1 Tax=Pseudomonas sp. DG56-2 TaxID=2320270 RepID=UPI0010A67FCE|nr:hypothetical protein [Pseudomonas sp. DG56-2]
MDVLEFAQCLSYVELIKQKKSTFEMLLPYGGALIGVVVGFVINVIRDKIKDKTSNAKKIICVDEEVHRLRNLFEVCASESMNVILSIYKGGKPSSTRLPPGYKAPLLKEFFPQVALKYSVNERYYLKELLSHTKKVEHLSEKLIASEAGVPMFMAALETLEASAYCVGVCDLFYKEPSRGEVPDLLKNLGFDDEQIDIYNKSNSYE